MKAPSRNPHKKKPQAPKKKPVIKDTKTQEEPQTDDVIESVEESDDSVKYKGLPYIIHQIECLCIDPSERLLSSNSHYYLFNIFQLIDDEGAAMGGVFQCDNCGRKWQVNDVDDYDFVAINENPVYSPKNIDKLLPARLVLMLNEFKCESYVKAWCLWVLQNKKWGESICIQVRVPQKNQEILKFKLLTLHTPTKYDIKELSGSKVASFDV
jgi:hypothetical protein